MWPPLYVTQRITEKYNGDVTTSVSKGKVFNEEAVGYVTRPMDEEGSNVITKALEGTAANVKTVGYVTQPTKDKNGSDVITKA